MNSIPRRFFLAAAMLPFLGPAAALAVPPAPAARNPGPAAGDPAPDFELPRLVPAANGAPAGSGGKVRLSSFRQKRPVVLVLSSYT